MLLIDSCVELSERLELKRTAAVVVAELFHEQTQEPHCLYTH
jgi:hypothetical protein